MIGPPPGPGIWTKHEESRRTGTPMTEREQKNFAGPVPMLYIVATIIIILWITVFILGVVGVHFW